MTLLSVKIFPQTMTLDKSIETVADGIIKQILMRNISEVFDFSSSIKTITVAILDFDSSSNALSEYVSYDLTKYFLGNMRFTVVDRQNLDRARKELNFNKTFEVSEENAQRIGHFVGAQVVVFGSIKPFGNMYRMQARAITVEKAVVLAQESISIKNDDILTVLTPKQPKPPKQKTDYNYLQQFGIGLLNIPLGFGSLLFDQDKDWVLYIIGAEVFGAGCGAVYTYVYCDSTMSLPKEELNKRMLIGAGVGFGIGAIIGFGRAFFIHKPGYYASNSFPIDINLVSTSSNDAGVQMVYTLSF
jgi:TolB-like protein